MTINQYENLETELKLHSQILKNLAEGVYLVKVSDLTIVYATLHSCGKGSVHEHV